MEERICQSLDGKLSNAAVSSACRRQFLAAAAGAGIAAIAGCIGDDNGNGNGTDGDNFPSDTITVIVPFGAGGGTDSQYRGFDEFFSDELGVSTNVDNRDGAGGVLGFNELYEEEPDGYTVGVKAVASSVLNERLSDTAYTMDDMTTIGTTTVSYYALVTEPGRFEDFDEVLEYAENEDLSVASPGPGTASHFSLVAMLLDQGIKDFDEVPYDDGAEAAAAAGSGDVDIGTAEIGGISGLVEDDQVDVQFINSPEALDDYPDVPTHADYNFDVPSIGLEVGMFGPPGIDDDRIEALESALLAVTEDEEFQEWANNQGYEVSGLNAQETRELLDEMIELSSDYVEQVEG